MTRRTVRRLVIGGAVLAGLVLWLSQPVCACTRAPVPVPPPTEVAAGVQRFDAAQERFYAQAGHYTDSLPALAEAGPLVEWDLRFGAATERGYDVTFRPPGDSLGCSYVVLRATNDTVPRRQVECYRSPLGGA